MAYVTFTVQSQDLFEFLAMFVQGLDTTVGQYTETIVKCHFTWVWNSENCILRFITGCTRIEKIRVFTYPARIDRHRIEMVDMKCRAAAVPPLTMKAVHAPKHELVAQPLPIAPVGLVTRRALPPHVRLRWILQSDHPTLPAFIGRLENSLSSRSPSVWLGRGATLSMW